MTTQWTGRSGEIECEGCANSIKRTLGKLAGVESVAVTVDSKTIAVSYDSSVTNEEAIKARLEGAGFPAETAAA